MRGEFFIFVFLSLIHLFFKSKELLKTLIVSLLIIIIVSPYLYRNFNTFGVLTITKSSGYNLLKETIQGQSEDTPMFLKVGEVIPEAKDG